MSEMSWSPVRGAVAVLFFGSVAALSFACGDKDNTAKPEAAGSAKPAAAASSGAPGAKAATPAKGAKPEGEGAKAEDAKPSGPVTTPEQQSYPMGNIKAIPDNCSNAHAIIANAPKSLGEDYAWPYTKQALLANQQFKTVSSASAPGQVSFAMYEANGAYALVAKCGDGSTCNRLAAMYKHVVKSSSPQVMCGDVPSYMGAPVKQVSLISGDPASNVPQAGDTIGMCARIAACTIATKPDTTDDVGSACQKGPSNFKTQCASKYPCAEVMACIGQ
jgi:hypothetical protein